MKFTITVYRGHSSATGIETRLEGTAKRFRDFEDIWRAVRNEYEGHWYTLEIDGYTVIDGALDPMDLYDLTWDGSYIDTGININCKRYPFIDWILMGTKTIETRNTPSLRPYIGRRVGLIETGKGKAKLRGFATIRAEYEYRSEEDFFLDSAYHMIDPYMKEYAFKNGGKYGYLLEDICWVDGTEVSSKGIVARRIL